MHGLRVNKIASGLGLNLKLKDSLKKNICYGQKIEYTIKNDVGKPTRSQKYN